VIYELRIAAAPMADLRLFRRRSFAATGFVAFAISAAVIGMIPDGRVRGSVGPGRAGLLENLVGAVRRWGRGFRRGNRHDGQPRRGRR
jgi:hypothetical protein